MILGTITEHEQQMRDKGGLAAVGMVENRQEWTTMKVWIMATKMS